MQGWHYFDQSYLSRRRRMLLEELVWDQRARRDRFKALTFRKITLDLPRNHRNLHYREDGQRVLAMAQHNGLLPHRQGHWEWDGQGESVSIDIYGWVPGLACFQVRAYRKEIREGDLVAFKQTSYCVTDGTVVVPVPEELVLEGIDMNEINVFEPFPHLEAILPAALKDRIRYPSDLHPLPVCPLAGSEIHHYPPGLESDLAWAVARGETTQQIRRILSKTEQKPSEKALGDSLAWSLVWHDRDVMKLLLELGASPSPLLDSPPWPGLESGHAVLERLLLEQESSNLRTARGEDLDLLL